MLHPVTKTLLFLFENQLLDQVSMDSRSLGNSEKTVFFAIKGPNFDGHDFIEEVLLQKVQHFVVEKTPKKLKNKANFYEVKNTLRSLQDFAAAYRKQFEIPIIGITGSNGKTIIKEWLYFLLSPDYHTAKNPKSYNSQVGVPLSVLGLEPHHQIGVFEAGISTVNEMVHLQKIIQPTIGILTNIGTAHDEGFENVAQKIAEKLQLFTEVDVLIYRKNKSLETFISNTIPTFSWCNKSNQADVWIQVKKQPHQSVILVTYKQLCFKVPIPFTDDGSIENAVHCLMVLLYLEMDVETIQERMPLLYPIEMRLKIKQGIHQTTLIDDSYSADIASLKIALDFLENQKQHPKKTVIITDLVQSGLQEIELYQQLVDLFLKNKIDRVFCVGPTISKYKNLLPNCKAYEHTKDFLEDIPQLLFHQETILIKGAREFYLEQAVALLEQKTHETVLEINLNALSHNLHYYKALLQPNIKMMVMVKAFSYGNGGLEIAKLLEYHKVDYLGVAFADEGIALKTNGIQTPIMVLNPEISSFEAIIQHQLEPEIYSFNGLFHFLEVLKEKNLTHYPIHLKLDTGMHRLGFQEQDLPKLLLILKNNASVKIQSILSHLAASEDLQHQAFTKQQIQLFDQLSLKISEELNLQPLRHLVNSSGIHHYPEAQFDMVRLGIGLYGIENIATVQHKLERVGTLKSVISQIRTIPAEDSVGYGRRFVAKKEMQIATIPIGYADGIRRAWGNEKGYVMIHQQKAPIVGSICMDMLMVDVTDISCQEGNEVIVLGERPNLQEMAETIGTIPYEILTGISQRVKRIFYRE